MDGYRRRAAYPCDCIRDTKFEIDRIVRCRQRRAQRLTHGFRDLLRVQRLGNRNQTDQKFLHLIPLFAVRGRRRSLLVVARESAVKGSASPREWQKSGHFRDAYIRCTMVA